MDDLKVTRTTWRSRLGGVSGGLVRCYAEDWLTPADLAGPWHGPDDFGYGDRETVLLFRAWGRCRRACREWESDHPTAPRIAMGRPLWRGTPPADGSPANPF